MSGGEAGDERWLPEGFVHPARVDLPTGHHLRPIRATDVDIDMVAVMGPTRERLWAMYGDVWGWPPPTMTHAEDEADLARHERDMAEGIEFNYAILDEPEEHLLGCIYIFPPETDEQRASGADAVVAWWVVDDELDGPLEAALTDVVPQWLAEAWPFATVRHGL